MIYRQILTYFFLIALIPLSAKALPPPSPAGGNYLALDGVDDYAVLDFKTFGTLLPEGTDEFTIEAWVYPTTPPADDIHAMILSQQVRMDVVNDVHDGWEDIRNDIDWQKGDVFLRIRAHFMVGEKSRYDTLSPESTFAEPMASHRFSVKWASDNNNH